MKRLVILIILAILLIWLDLLVSSDKDISVADTSIPNNKTISSATNTGNSPASATITITMYAEDGE